MRLISRRDFAAKLCVGRTTLWKLETTDPAFPRPVTIGAKTAFVETEADGYVATLAARRGPVVEAA
jgi:predicted DNA-binding transcriptional regulator AlpA